jgi:hypothetical protein
MSRLKPWSMVPGCARRPGAETAGYRKLPGNGAGSTLGEVSRRSRRACRHALGTPQLGFLAFIGPALGGLVTTAAGALNLESAFRDLPAGFLIPDLADEAARDQTKGLNGRLDGLFE